MLQYDKKSGEIYMYGVVGNITGTDNFDALSVIMALKDIGNKRAVVHINSPGGLADHGIAIYNALKSHKAGVETHNDSLAASAASIIFLAGDKRTASAGSRVMIHRAMNLVVGNADDMRKFATTLEAYDQSMVDIYSEYMPEGTDVLSLMAAETWYKSSEAVQIGFANGVGKSTNATPQIAAWMQNVPEEVKNFSQVKRYKYAIASKGNCFIKN
jgi:ATP-dependent protease ClpP protease subunit